MPSYNMAFAPKFALAWDGRKALHMGSIKAVARNWKSLRAADVISANHMHRVCP